MNEESMTWLKWQRLAASKGPRARPHRYRRCANAEDGHLEEASTRLLCSRMPARLLLRARNASSNRSVKARRRQPHRIRHDVLLRWQSDWTLQPFTKHCQLGVDMAGCRSASPAIETSAAIPYGVRTIVIPWPLRAQRIGHRLGRALSWRERNGAHGSPLRAATISELLSRDCSSGCS